MSEASPPTEVVAFGDRAWRFPLRASLDRRALLASLLALDGVVDVVLAEDHGAAIANAGAPPDLPLAIAHALSQARPDGLAPPPTLHVIAVAYDGQDLAALAERLSLSVEAAIALHAQRDYEVAMVGFMPGFAYLRGLDPRLVVARRDSPRTRVPARSVAIAAEYTGIYPFASPGGWHLLGEAVDFSAFDARGAALAVGDRVRFAPTTRDPERPAPAAASMPTVAVPGPWLEVRAARGPALLIDGGRPGRMHEGVPHGGPMVRSGLARANAAVGNEASDNACAVEVYGEIEVTARGGRVVVGDDTHGARALDEGEVHAVATAGRARVAYLAVQGGFDVPVVLGGRGTMMMAGIGGFEGRALRRGDRLNARASARPHAGAGGAAEHERREAAVALMPGPDASDGELAALVGATFTIARASDRTGTRLDGPPLSGSMHSAHDRRSGPMVRGAIERTPAGLIVLGPDHPTTGGYPVVAVLREEAMDRFFATPVGHPVRFMERA